MLLYGDGGFTRGEGATYSAQPRHLGPHDNYWHTSSAASEPVSARLPVHYGYEGITIHCAEMMALLAALRWRQPGRWNCFVGDRSALFQVLKRACSQSATSRLASPCIPLDARLHNIMLAMASAWDDNDQPTPPRWRLDQVQQPEHWNVTSPNEHNRSRTTKLSELAFQEHGLIGVDVKSHQTTTTIPYPAIVQGNEAQDNYCTSVYRNAQPPDIHLPT